MVCMTVSSVYQMVDASCLLNVSEMFKDISETDLCRQLYVYSG